MESFEIGENRTQLLPQLSLMKQLLVQLQNQFNEPSSSSIEFSKCIVSRLLSENEKSIFLAKSCGFEPVSPPLSTNSSPRSDMSDLPFKSQDNKVCKKRKTQQKWKNQVRVGSINGGVETLNDGYSWRKYGQKDILGAKHPRGYYRCTHRNSQGCMATKQMQRTDEDSAVFDVIYQGQHTCLNKSRSANNNNNNNKQMNQLQLDEDYLNSLKAALTIKTEGSGSLGLAQQEAHYCNSRSFSFPSNPIESGHVATLDNGFNTSNGFLPSFANSPATSESNYFSIFSSCMGGELGFRKVNSDLAEVISGSSAATSTTNSPMAGADQFVFDSLDFDQNFQIDPSSFFA